MRLIDADALLKHECEADRMGAMLVVGKGYILDAPEIDAVPVVRGEWIKSALCEPSDWVKCSLCGRYFYLRDIQPTDNCPNCGAKMEDKP